MARKTPTYISQLKALTTPEIEKMSREQLINLLVGGSKVAANVSRELRKSDYATESALLIKRSTDDENIKMSKKVTYDNGIPKDLKDYTQEERIRNTITVKEVRREYAEKMSNTQIKNNLFRLSNTVSTKTFDLKGTKEYYDKIMKMSGYAKSPSGLSSDDWARMRKLMKQGYKSEEVIEYYDAALSDDEIKEKIEYARGDGMNTHVEEDFSENEKSPEFETKNKDFDDLIRGVK